jgi:hypothetical protein
MAGYSAARAGGTVDRSMLMSQPGIAPGDDMVAWLWDHRVAAIAADNCGVERMPVVDRSSVHGFLHPTLIAGLGMALGELFFLDDLASHCERTGRYTACFMSAPMNVPGGVGSPGNALAIT